MSNIRIDVTFDEQVKRGVIVHASNATENMKFQVVVERLRAQLAAAEEQRVSAFAEMTAAKDELEHVWRHIPDTHGGESLLAAVLRIIEERDAALAQVAAMRTALPPERAAWIAEDYASVVGECGHTQRLIEYSHVAANDTAGDKFLAAFRAMRTALEQSKREHATYPKCLFIYDGSPCDCGADGHNAIIDAALALADALGDSI